MSEKSSRTHINIDYVANLARLELSEEEKKLFSAQLENILHYFDKLNKVDVSGVEALAHPFSSYNVWQEDVPTEPFTVEEALANAPQVHDGQIVVPKIIE